MRQFHLKKRIRQTKALGRVKELKAFAEVKRIALLFDPSDYQQVMEFVSMLEEMGKTVRLWTFAEVESPEWEYAPKSRYLTRKHVDFWGLPKQYVVDDYQGFPVDMLMNLSHHPNWVLDYLAALSPATFRVGFKPDEAKDYDFVLAYQEETSDFKENANSLLFYLKNLRLK